MTISPRRTRRTGGKILLFSGLNLRVLRVLSGNSPGAQRQRSHPVIWPRRSVIEWSAALVLAAAFVAPASAQNVETDPIQCWWRTSAGAVRAGEAFSVVLTCAVVENDTAKVVVDQAKLEPSVVQFVPFEVVPAGSSHGADLRADQRRFFQYEYRLRLVADNLFGKDVALPETKLSYHVQSQVAQAAAIQGRDQSYVLPPLAIRVLSLVPTTASDIRDGTIETFSDIDRRGFRASVLVVVGGVLFGLAALMALLALVRLVARFQKPSAATSRLVSDGAILRAVGRELRTVQRAREDGGWTPGLAGRALGALRIAAAYALGRHVAQTLIQEPVDTHQAVVVGHLAPVAVRPWTVANQMLDGQLTVYTGWPKRRPIAISAPITPQGLAYQIARGNNAAKRAVMLETFEQALTRFTTAQYGREAAVDDAALDDSLAAAARALTQLKIDQTWLMKRLSRGRAAPEVESRAWSR
jgi:hypothetical protein